MSLTYFWIFIILLATGAPVVFALLIGPGLSLLLDRQPEFYMALLSRLYNGMNSFPLMAVPFFILAGEVMHAGGVTASLVRLSQSMIVHLRGGLAQVRSVLPQQVQLFVRVGTLKVPDRPEVQLEAALQSRDCL